MSQNLFLVLLTWVVRGIVIVSLPILTKIFIHLLIDFYKEGLRSDID